MYSSMKELEESVKEEIKEDMINYITGKKELPEDFKNVGKSIIKMLKDAKKEYESRQKATFQQKSRTI